MTTYHHLTPDQRKLPARSDSITREQAWEVVQEHRNLIYGAMRKFMSRVMNRPINMRGVIFGSNFEWYVKGTWFGRDARDALQELESATLENALKAVETFDPERGAQLSTHIVNCVNRGLIREIERWRVTMASDDNASINAILSSGMSPEQLVDRGDPVDDVVSLRHPREVVGDDTAEKGMAASLAQKGLDALSHVEAQALRRKAEGMTLKEIGAELGMTKAGAQNAVERAIQKAARAIGTP
jgi:RNA polymerase sigma factor (sigma-70 family)